MLEMGAFLRLPTAIIIPSFLVLSLFPTISLSLPVSSTSFPRTDPVFFSFSFPSSLDASAPPLDLYGDAHLDDAGAVTMSPTTNTSASTPAGGLLMYARPIDFGRKPNFTADITFSISPGPGNGFALFLAPTGLVSAADLMRAGVPPGVFAVEFDTSLDAKARDPNGNHIGVDVGSDVSVRAFNVTASGVLLASGDKLRAWIDYDGDNGVLEVRLSNRSSRPKVPLATCRVDLAGIIWQDAMLVGISSSSSNNTRNTSSSQQQQPQVVTIYSWTFSLSRTAPYRMHSQPLDPVQSAFDAAAAQQPKQIPLVVVQEGPGNGEEYYTSNLLMALALGVACGAAIALLIVLLCSAKVQGHHPVAPQVEYQSAKTSEYGYEKIVVLTELSSAKEDKSDKAIQTAAATTATKDST